MSANDELCRLLDELRKLANDINEEEIRSHSVITLNQGRYNRQFRLDMNYEWLNAWHAELERILQAIEVTLGQGTCHNEAAPNCRDYWFCCSECGFVAHTNKTAINYCPNCGRKVVGE